MTAEERDNIISELVLLTGYAETAFSRMDDERLREELKRRTESERGLV